MYKNLAYVYDRLMYDVDYAGWACFLESICKKENIKIENILDLACGTGSLTLELLKLG